jgi:hypothetical protein
MNQADGSKLWKAARAGDVKIIRQLLPQIDVKQPADKDWLDRSLAQAVHGRSVEAADLLLKAGANPDQDTSIGTLVAWPAGNGDLPMVKRLVEAGVKYNQEFKKETALGANPNAKGKHGFTALDLVSKSRQDIAELIKKYGGRLGKEVSD